MTNEVRVPVRLDMLKESISEIQGILAHLQPDTTGFKKLSKYLQELTNEMTKFQAQTNSAFGSQAAFNKAGKSVDKMEESLNKARVAIQDLKFSDIKLDSNQLKAFSDLEREIESITSKLDAVKEKTKQDILSNDVTKNLISSIDPKYVQHSFDEISKIIDTEVNKLSQKTLQANTKLNDFLSKREAKSSEIKALTTYGISKEGLGEDVFKRFFQESSKGILSFNSTNFASGEAKKQFIDYLAKEFSLTKADIDQITEQAGKGTAGAFDKLFKQMGNSITGNVFTNRLESNTFVETKNLKQAVEDALTAQRALEEVQRQFATEQGDNGAIGQAAVQYAEALERVRTSMDTLKTSALENIQNSPKLAQGFQASQEQLNRFKRTLEETNTAFLKQQRAIQTFNSMKMAIVNFMGFNQVLRLTQRAVTGALNHIKELDTVMNKISIVTDMSTGDLWNQVDAYSKLAQSYGVSIKGAYEVSQIYYQQGLETKDVMTLTNETLKLAKVSGLDYAQTTDYMTTALRGFKMEMSDAGTIVDVYSNLAAHTAVTQEELAVAMSKTASSMESVGATFQEASAMIGTMVTVTRESATNIGSALKSIASRYGELKKDPSALIDSEGEEMAFNKVDTALQSVGISMKTTDGQFRNFTDVIIELSEKWSELESTQQRYIATQFAGNRQQSRFLALVSNPELLKANLSYAENSEDTGQLQALKALDSIESKIEQVKVAYQQFYTTIGVETVWKGFLDGAKNTINTLNSFPKLFDKIPVGAIAAIANMVNIIKNLGMKALTSFAETFGQSLFQSFQASQGIVQEGAEGLFASALNALKSKTGQLQQVGKEGAQAYAQGLKTGATGGNQNQITGEAKIQFDKNTSAVNLLSQVTDDTSARAASVALLNQGNISLQQFGIVQREGAEGARLLTAALAQENEQILANASATQQNTQAQETNLGKVKQFITAHKGWGNSLQNIGSALHMASMMIDTSVEGGKTLSGTLMSVGGAATLAGVAVQAFNRTLKGIPWMAVITGAFALINGLSTLWVSAEERIEELEKKAEELSNIAKKEKANEKTLNTSIEKVKELNEKRYESKEAAEQYQTAIDDLAEKFPELIAGFDEAGNVMVTIQDAESLLTAAREKSAKATYDAAEAELKSAQEKTKNAKNKLTTAQTNFEDSLDIFLENFNKTKSTANVQRYDFMEKWVKEQNNKQLEEDFAYAYKGWMDESDFKFFSKTYGVDTEGFKLDNSALTEEQKAIDELQNAYSAYKLANDLNSDEGKKALARVTKAVNALSQFKLTDTDLGIEDLLHELNEELGNVVDLSALEKGLANKTVSAWQQLTNNNDQLWSYLEESAGAAAIVTSGIIKEWENAGPEQYELTDANIQIFANRSKAREMMENFWIKLTSEQRDLFNKMYDDPSNYSAIDFEREFGSSKGWSSDLNDLITNYYTGVKSLQERLTQNLKNRTTVDSQGNFISQFDKDLNDAIKHTTTEVEANFLDTVLDIEKKLESEGYQTRSTDFGNAAIKLFDQVTAIGGDIEKGLWQTISEKGINTLEGIKDIREYITANENIQNKEELLKQLKVFENTIIPNINLEIQTATSNLLDTWEDTSKDLTKALSSGVTLKEADQLMAKAKQLGIKGFDLTKFQLVGDKLVLTQDAFGEYYDALINSSSLAVDDLSAQIQQAGKLLAGYGGGSHWEYNDEERALLKGLGFDITNTDYYKNGALTYEGAVALNEAIAKNQEALSNYSRAAQIAADQLLNSTDRANGIYKYSTEDLKPIDDATLRQIASNLHISKDDIQDASIKESLNKAYGSLLSDVLSKGIENVNPTDYEGLIKGQDIAGDLQSLNYESFIKKYIEYTGQTIDEANDMLLQAIEKDRESVSADLIKDLKFFDKNTVEVNRSQLNNFAKVFNKSFGEILDKLNLSFDDVTGNAMVSLTALADVGIDLTQIQGAGEIVADAVRAFYEEIASTLNSAIKGSASIEQVKSLQQFADQYHVGPLNFVETTNGLKLATTQAINLYNVVKSINAIQGEVVFKELMDSLIATDEHYSSIGNQTNYILQLTEKINAENAKLVASRATGDEFDDTKIRQYEQELELAKEIQAVRSTQEDSSFNFMSNKIPAAQNNPLNYYKSWSSAFHKIQDAFKTSTVKKNGKAGFIDYEDWYNIVTEMNNIAKLGEPIEVAGYTLDGSLKSAAALIQEGANALTTVDTGEIKVNLASIGTGISSSAELMGENVSKGISSMAKSQVKMLDGMIQLLETIVAMEQLGDIDVDTDNILDLSEIFKVKTGKDNLELPEKYWDEYTDKFKTSASKILKMADEDKELAKALDEVKVNGISLHDMFKDTTNQTKKLDIDAEAYTAVMNSFYQAAISGDYNLDNIVASVREVLGGSGFEGEITVGDTKLTVHAGAVITTDKDGNYTVNGVNYGTNLDAATKGFHSQNVEVLSEAISSVSDTETGVTTYTLENGAEVVVDYNLETKEFIATLNGSTVRASSKAELEFAIAALARLESTSLEASETVSFHISQNGEAEVEVIVDITNPDDPKITVNGGVGLDEEAQKAIIAKAQEFYGTDKATAVQAEKPAEMAVDADLQVHPKNVTVQMAEGVAAIPLSTPLIVAPETVIAKIEGLIPTLNGTLSQADYDTLEAAITTLKAIYSGTPDVTGVTLNNFSYTDVVTATLTSLLLKISNHPEITGKEITLGDTRVSVTDTIKALLSHLTLANEGATIDNNVITLPEGQKAQVSDVITALLTQIDFSSENATVVDNTITLPNGTTISLSDFITACITGISSFDSSTAEVTDKTISLPNNTELSVASAVAIISTLLLNWGEDGQKDPDISALNLPTQFISPEIYDLVIRLRAKYELTDDQQFLQDYTRDYLQSNYTKTGSSVTGIDMVQYGPNARDWGSVITDKDAYSNTKRYIDLLNTDVTNNNGILSEASRSTLTDLASTFRSLSEDTGDSEATEYLNKINETLGASTANALMLKDGLSELSSLETVDTASIDKLASAMDTLATAGQALAGINWVSIAQGIQSLFGGNTETPMEGFNLSSLFEGGISNPFTAIAATLDEISASKIEALRDAAESIIPGKAEDARTAINTIDPHPAQAAKSALSNISITGKSVQAIANVIVRVTHSRAKGNVALAAGTPTLMGELGPELVVSNGHYFVAGQMGAEFVNLEKDAIVFNHKQTERLMSSGSIGSRGKPFTNEQNAISYAKGNVTGPAQADGKGSQKEVPWKTGWTYNYNIQTSTGGVSGHLWHAPIAEIKLPAAAKGTGPAMASASAALAALKQLRAQWNALANLSAKDLAGKGGGGGGGGGDPKAFIKDLERWYDWLQQIAQLEKEINKEEAKRNEYQSNLIAHGKEYYISQIATLDKLKQQIAVERSLLSSQQEYFNKRRKELNEQSAFSALYGFSETGQLYYKNVYGDKSAFEWLSDLAGRNETTGEANYTAEEQYNQLVAAGFEAFMKYDSSGNEIKQEGNEWYSTAVQAFWDKIDADKEEMQSLHDSIMEHEQATVEAQNNANEILQAIRDNQIDLEKDVLKAIEEIRQREIDNLKDEKDAIKESTDALVDGLNEQMQREQQMYQNQQNQNEVTKIQRQLSILQRSGGSASEIANLQKQLSDKQKDMYFDAQQQQIDAIKDAADRQIEKLEKQIELMEETLAYEKEHGILWQEVYAVMSESPEYIAEFIMKNTKEYWGQSATEYEKSFTEELFKAQQWGEFRDNTGNIYDLLNKYLNPEEAEAPTISDEEIGGNTGASAPAPAGSGGGGGGGNGKKSKEEYIYTKIDDTYHMKKKLQSDGTYKDVGKEKHRYNNGRCVCGANAINYAKGPISDSYANAIVDNSAKAAQTQTKTVITPQSTLKPTTTTTANTLLDTLNKLKIKKKASGGYTGHGLYEIGEQGTEAIFTAEQTQILRENILSDRPSSLISLLKSYNEAYRGLSQSTYDSISDNSNSVTIERAEVNMNVAKIADDYDAQRAGEEALSKMLEIARKTTANNRIGR